MNKIIKNISMLVLVAFTVAACGGGGGGAGTALNVNNNSDNGGHVINDGNGSNGSNSGTESSEEGSSDSNNDNGSGADLSGNITQPDPADTAHYEYTPWTAWAPATAPASQPYINQTRSRIDTCIVTIKGQPDANQPDCGHHDGISDSQTIQNPAYTDVADNGITTYGEWTEWLPAQGDGKSPTFEQSRSRTRKFSVEVVGWPDDVPPSNPHGNFSQVEGRTSTDNSYQADTAAWSTGSHWLISHYTGGVAGEPAVNTVSVTEDYDIPNGVNNYVWDAIVPAASTVATVTQTGTKTTTVAAYSYYTQDETTTTTTGLSPRYRHDIRECLVTVNGAADAITPTCSGNAETRSVLVDNAVDGTSSTEVVEGSRVWHNVPESTSAPVAVTQTVDNPAYVSPIWDGTGNPTVGQGSDGTASTGFDTVTGTTSGTDFYINNTGTGTASTAISSTFTSLTSSIDDYNGTDINDLSFYNDTILKAHANGWDGTGTTIFGRVYSSQDIPEKFAPGATSKAHDHNPLSNMACVTNTQNAGSCNSENGVTINSTYSVSGVTGDLHNITYRQDGVIGGHTANNSSSNQPGSAIDKVASGVSLVWHKFDALDDEQIEDLIKDTATTHENGNLVFNLGKALLPVGNLN